MCVFIFILKIFIAQLYTVFPCCVGTSVAQSHTVSITHHQSNHCLIKSTARVASSLHAAASPSVHGGTWLLQTCSNQRRIREPGGHRQDHFSWNCQRRVLALYGNYRKLPDMKHPSSHRTPLNKCKTAAVPGCSDSMELLPLWYRSS